MQDRIYIPIFAALSKRRRIGLDYGVMVAQQVLVLFVQVRILVVQQQKRGIRGYLFFCYPYSPTTSPSVIDYRGGSNALPRRQYFLIPLSDGLRRSPRKELHGALQIHAVRFIKSILFATVNIQHGHHFIPVIKNRHHNLAFR